MISHDTLGMWFSQQTIGLIYTESSLAPWRSKMKPEEMEGPWEVHWLRAKESRRFVNSVLGEVESERYIMRNILFICVVTLVKTFKNS